jgi:uncharacterized OsmC-like protein
MSTVTETKKVNGLDTKQLFESVDALRNMPNLGEFRLWLRNQWLGGTVNRSVIKNFYGLGREDDSRKEPFVLDADEPPVLLGQNAGPSPVEYLLTALASCVTSSLVIHAAAKGIEIEELESRVEGDIDVRGFLGLDENVPKGYKKIRIRFKIKANLPDDQLEELCKLGATFSPVYNTLTKGVPVDVQVDR